MTGKIRDSAVYLGCDPELFLSQNGEIVESGPIINSIPDTTDGWSRYSKKWVDVTHVHPDGIQIELNPSSQQCRQLLADGIIECFKSIKADILDKHSLQLNYDGVVQIAKDKLAAMSKDAKVFGCARSYNINPAVDGVIPVDPATYTYRSAGGHIHLGSEYLQAMQKEEGMKYLKLTVAVLDIVLANTMVLIDKDPMQAERRKVYGRAGEYRYPTHGLEYRTLSNRWLRSYPIFSLTFGQARFATLIGINIYRDEVIDKMGEGKSQFRKLFDLVNYDDVAKAINTNDFDLAKSNFDKIKDYLVEIAPQGLYHAIPLNKTRLQYFEYMVDKGLDYFFSKDVLANWLKPERSIGWENFCYKTIHASIRHDKDVAMGFDKIPNLSYLFK